MGFRMSHEVAKVEQVTREDLRAMIDDDLVRRHRARGMTPDRPVSRIRSEPGHLFPGP
jgi:pyruvate-ferredoxin/flavodoxin oxidoreductase